MVELIFKLYWKANGDNQQSVYDFPLMVGLAVYQQSIP